MDRDRDHYKNNSNQRLNQTDDRQTTTESNNPSNRVRPQNSQNNSSSVFSEHPIIPDEVGNPNCPVCLTRVNDRSYTNTCLHEFCFPCIQEWSRNHNRCPVCREIYSYILHNIKSNAEYDRFRVAEPSVERQTGVLLTNGNSGLIATPLNSGIYIINPMLSTHVIRYELLFLGPNQTYIIQNVNPDMIFVDSQDLEHVLTHLNEMGIHRPHPHHGSHPHFLQHHNRHSRRYPSNSRYQENTNQNNHI